MHKKNQDQMSLKNIKETMNLNADRLIKDDSDIEYIGFKENKKQSNIDKIIDLEEKYDSDVTIENYNNNKNIAVKVKSYQRSSTLIDFEKMNRCNLFKNNLILCKLRL